MSGPPNRDPPPLAEQFNHCCPTTNTCRWYYSARHSASTCRTACGHDWALGPGSICRVWFAVECARGADADTDVADIRRQTLLDMTRQMDRSVLQGLRSHEVQGVNWPHFWSIQGPQMALHPSLFVSGSLARNTKKVFSLDQCVCRPTKILEWNSRRSCKLKEGWYEK